MRSCLSNYRQDKVIKVQRMSDRVMAMKLVRPAKNFNIISAYVPQQGCSQEDKDGFCTQLEGVMSRVASTVEMILAGDMNGHVGAVRTGFERWHGGKSVAQRNKEGGRILELA